MSVRDVLLAVHDRGPGHAAHDPVLIHAPLDTEHRVSVLSNGRALALMDEWLGDIPEPLGRCAWGCYLRMSLSRPQEDG